MSGFRLLDLVNFFLPLTPEVMTTTERITFDERVIFTVGSAIIYLVGQMPLYQLKSGAPLLLHDPFASFRTVFGMERATLFELGLLPVITAAFLWQLAVGCKLVNVNLTYRSERELFQTGQKLTSFALAAIMAGGLIFAGYYDGTFQGTSIAGTVTQQAFVFAQLFGWSAMVTLMVEIFDKDYGFGSGILSFLALQGATNLVRAIAGIEMLKLANSNKYESVGAFTNVFRNFRFLDWKPWSQAVLTGFSRQYLPNFSFFYVGIAAMIAAIGLQNFRIELPIRSTKVRGMANVFPIRLLYTGALPLLFAYTVIANIQVFGFITVGALDKFGLTSPISRLLLGSYQLDVTNNLLVPVSGLLSYLTATTSLVGSVLSPIRAVVYSATMVVLAVWFGNKWADISGAAPRDIAKQFKDQGISISGRRDISIAKELSRVIPVAAVAGAFVLAALAIVGDFLGGVGAGAASAIGTLAAFSIIEEFMMEMQQSGGASQFTNAMGMSG
ncbi:sec sixty-one protein homolog [Diutina catenulata]